MSKSLKISISFPAALFFALVFNISGETGYLFSLTAAAAHETAHILCMLACGCTGAEMVFHPGGIAIKPKGFERLGYGKTVLCILIAPAVNLIAGAVFFGIFRHSGNELFRDAAEINAVLGAVNLIPLSFLDGGRALSELLEYASELPGKKRLECSDRIITVMLGFTAVIPCFFGKGSFFLVIFFAYCFFTLYLSEQKC